MERSGKIAKTHSGVRAEFAKLTRANLASRPFLTFLAQAYIYKKIGDYGVGASAVVTVADADVAISGAAGFLDHVRGLHSA